MAHADVAVPARGNLLVHVLNGQVVTVSIDDRQASRAAQGAVPGAAEAGRQASPCVPRPRRLGTIEIRGSQVLLGPPLRFTRANIDRYDF